MKRIYLYIAILISLVANIFFYSIMKKNDNKVVPQNTVASDEYLNEELGKAYSYLKLNGKKFENIKGTLGYQDKTIGRTELETLIRGDNVVFYFSDLSCSSCIMEHLNSLEKLKKNNRRENVDRIAFAAKRCTKRTSTIEIGNTGILYG